MFDKIICKKIAPLLAQMAEKCVRAKITANNLTIANILPAMAAVFAIGNEFYLLGLFLILINRLIDGLDGAVARLTAPTDMGAFLDIVFDFIFYASIPFAFIMANGDENALMGGLLLVSFMGTASSFLAFAIMAERHHIKLQDSKKGFYYLNGLTEGFETILAFALMCISPVFFNEIATIFAILCAITILSRIYTAWKILK